MVAAICAARFPQQLPHTRVAPVGPITRSHGQNAGSPPLWPTFRTTASPWFAVKVHSSTSPGVPTEPA